jgi:hypothetical protein
MIGQELISLPTSRVTRLGKLENGLKCGACLAYGVQLWCMLRERKASSALCLLTSYSILTTRKLL